MNPLLTVAFAPALAFFAFTSMDADWGAWHTVHIEDEAAVQWRSAADEGKTHGQFRCLNTGDAPVACVIPLKVYRCKSGGQDDRLGAVEKFVRPGEVRVIPADRDVCAGMGGVREVSLRVSFEKR